MNKILAILLFGYSAQIFAQAYQCEHNGRVSFQSKPCTTATVGEANPMLSKSVAVVTDLSKINIESYAMNFSECKTQLLKMQLQANKQSFHTIPLQGDAAYYAVKVCTPDRAIVMACDGMKRKMLLRRREACS